ncbi:MAG: hypothetical protein JW891_00320 [Candidatus Lokiarchaeota archaeon]|nr:hypothetical protein [Candidatus Lokiarchaeota archaeon]
MSKSTISCLIKVGFKVVKIEDVLQAGIEDENFRVRCLKKVAYLDSRQRIWRALSLFSVNATIDHRASSPIASSKGNKYAFRKCAQQNRFKAR